MCEEKGITRYGLAQLIGSTPYQLLRVSKGENTSLKFLVRLVPIFGVEAIAGIIADHRNAEAFVIYAGTHRP